MTQDRLQLLPSPSRSLPGRPRSILRGSPSLRLAAVLLPLLQGCAGWSQAEERRKACESAHALVVRDANVLYPTGTNTARVVQGADQLRTLCKDISRTVSLNYLCGFHWRFDFLRKDSIVHTEWINVKCEAPAMLEAISPYFPDSSSPYRLYKIFLEPATSRKAFAESIRSESIVPFGLQIDSLAFVPGLVVRIVERSHRGVKSGSRLSDLRSPAPEVMDKIRRISGRFGIAVITPANATMTIGKDVTWEASIHSSEVTARSAQDLSDRNADSAITSIEYFEPYEPHVMVAAKAWTVAEIHDLVRTKPGVARIEELRFKRHFLVPRDTLAEDTASGH
ncbi:MAG TPA: hypothetical protein PKO15_04880 [Fibrobacteria bacterium]|nr:hypothetical protein [Fibrobacteria bacterium]